MFCAPELVFGDTECVGSCFLVLRSKARFRRYRGSQVPFSCFAFPDMFSAVTSATYSVYMFCAPGLIFGGPVFIFCAPGLGFGGTEGVGSRFHVLRAWTLFRCYRGRPLPFACFALPD
jgi:hypothetical protein